MKKNIIVATSILAIFIGILYRIFSFSFQPSADSFTILFQRIHIGWNISNLGFAYDTVNTQFVWGKTASQIGIFNFWQNYNTSFDYPFFALCYDIFIYKLSTLIGGTEHSFVIVMKSINIILDIVFAFFISYFLNIKFKFDKSVSILIAAILFALPISWFITAIWGQFDILLILGTFWACYTLIYLSPINNILCECDSEFKTLKLGKYEIKYRYLLAMLVLALCFWTKMNTIFILLPALLIIQRVSVFEFKKFIIVFSIISFILNIIPFLLNPVRFLNNGFFGGSRNVSNGADVFWTMFTTDKSYLTLFSIIGVLLLILTIVYLYKRLKLLEINSGNIFHVYLSVLTMFAFTYYYFSTSMHSRYSYIGVLFLSLLLMISFMQTSSRRDKILFIVIILLSNFAFLQNNSSVYVSWNYLPDYRLLTTAWSGIFNSLIFLASLGVVKYQFFKYKLKS